MNIAKLMADTSLTVKKIKEVVKKMITKEEFLKNTNEDEVFSVVEEFLNRLAEKGNEYKQLVILDRTKGEIIEDMLDDRR